MNSDDPELRRERVHLVLAAISSLACACTSAGHRARVEPAPEPPYTIAFASFAPLGTDVFIAAGDGTGARPLLAHSGQDYNGSLSLDGRWVVFTSQRSGSADVYRVHPDGSELTRLTDDPAFDDQGALSPDGRSLAFVSTRSGQADLWILDVATRKLRNLTDHPAGEFRPSWSPDGVWLAFSSDRDSARTKGRGGFETVHSTELYVIRRDGTGLRRVTNEHAFAGSPSWSNDGHRLVYYRATLSDVMDITSPRELRAVTQIAVVDLETNEVHPVTSGPGEKRSPRWLPTDRIGYVSGGPEGGIEITDAAAASGTAGARGEYQSPSWSADGSQMVFHRDVSMTWPPVERWPGLDPRFSLLRTGVFPSYSPSNHQLLTNSARAGILHNDILVMDTQGAHRSTLFSDPVKSALEPIWSPAGDRIAFAVGQFFQTVKGPAIADIAVMRRDGSDVKLLTDGTGNNGFPSWSPDGTRIVFRSSGGAHEGLRIVTVATGEVRQLTTGATHDNFPSWSPVDDSIAFTSNRDGDYELYSIKSDGTNARRLTRSPGNDAHNTWSPDGRWIAFTSARGGFKDESPLHPHNPQPYGELYVMRADGSDVRKLTDNQYEEGTPSWVASSPEPR
jgi:Tol biopolymer transport system component